MSKNLKVVLILTTVVAVAVVGYFYKQHEDSKASLVVQPAAPKNVQHVETTAPAQSAVDGAANKEMAAAPATTNEATAAAPAATAPAAAPVATTPNVKK